MLCYYLTQKTGNEASDQPEFLIFLLLQKDLRNHLQASQDFSLVSELSDQPFLYYQGKCDFFVYNPF